MADISLTKTHSKSDEDIQCIVEKLEKELSDSFELKTEKKGDTIYFKRSGVDGTICLFDQMIKIEIKLGMMMKMMAPTIETKLRQKLDQYLD